MSGLPGARIGLEPVRTARGGRYEVLAGLGFVERGGGARSVHYVAVGVCQDRACGYAVRRWTLAPGGGVLADRVESWGAGDLNPGGAESSALLAFGSYVAEAAKRGPRASRFVGGVL